VNARYPRDAHAALLARGGGRRSPQRNGDRRRITRAVRPDSAHSARRLGGARRTRTGRGRRGQLVADLQSAATRRGMTAQASDWSDHDLERRFSLGQPHDELTQLAFTLDRLLDRLAATLRHEQRLSAELSHELRTPLANIAAQAQFALRHTDQDEDG